MTRRGLDAGPGGELPDIDDRLAPPETRLEYFEGAELFAMPADPPHATEHFDLVYLLGAHAKPGYRGAVDMLMRADESSDFAPDASIFPEAPDPRTGRRQIEQLAFEVTSKQRLRVPTAKARKLIARGVRRVFCILVEKRRVLEWSKRTDGWEPLPITAEIKDRTLIRPLPVRSLLDTARRDDAVVEALLARGVPALERALSARELRGREEGRDEGREEGRHEGREEGRDEGILMGKRETLLGLLESRGIVVSRTARRRVEACDDRALLDAWITRAFTEPDAAFLTRAPAPRPGRSAGGTRARKTKPR